jgi:hypothetical protein
MRGWGDGGMRNGPVIPSERSESRDLHLFRGMRDATAMERT